ncbi:MAG: adenylate/guanylate cyclase domain-containing protein [Betaproteobacteria bacterium]|nr:adenylate/guanylate cyclase domain-containing protein [Betaproteobacteria bacterium]
MDLRTFISRLRSAGIEPSDSDELKVRKTIMVFSMGLMTAAPMFWLALYWLAGLQLSATLPLTYQLISVATLVYYILSANFALFQFAQLGLFLFFPFVVQLSIGNFISASGAVLWGILAPIIAVPVLGARNSTPWFVAHIAMMLICGFIDFELAGAAPAAQRVPVQVSVLFFVLNFVAIASIAYAVLRYSAREKQRYEAELVAANGLLRIEQERSERLLLNILPGPVAERLKREGETIADGFADVTVMFADIVNFTRIAEGLSPNQIFTMLNKIFSSFDALAEKHGLEKIKTIGDAYMVAGGMDGDAEVNYTEAIADMALDMRDVLATDHKVNEIGLELRMGIGTGPVVAGVVGKKKFIYDLWGDTVNIASRITAEGVPGMVQVDSTTYRRLRQRYDFLEPQTLYLKGKGETVVYRLLGRKAAVSSASAAGG